MHPALHREPAGFTNVLRTAFSQVNATQRCTKEFALLFLPPIHGFSSLRRKVWSPVAGTYKYHTSCCNGECYDRAAEKPGKRCSIWNKAELFSQHLAHAQLTAEADCEVVVEFIELCLKTFTGAAAANTSLAELALAAYEVLPLSEASADDIPLDRVKESIAVAVEELLFVEARVLPVCFNPEFSDDTAVDRALEASLAPIVSQIQPKHVGAGDYLSREDFGEALAEFQRINEVRTPRSKVLCIVRTFLELQKLGALAKTGKGKKHEGADELVPRFEYILLIAHGNTEAPIQLVTNTKFIQRFLCGSRRCDRSRRDCCYMPACPCARYAVLLANMPPLATACAPRCLCYTVSN